jgi:hypothetical protein
MDSSKLGPMNAKGFWAKAQLWGVVVLTVGATAVAAVMFTQGTRAPKVGDTITVKTSTPSSTDNNPHPIAGQFKPNGRTLEECNLSDYPCVEQAFGNLAFKEGAKVALARFDSMIGKPGPVESNCHRIAHTIGSASLARLNENVGKAFAEGSSSCWSGYYHGILEHAFLQLKSFEPDEVAKVSQALCSDPEIRKTSWLAYQCVHGLGHGLMITSGLDLPLSLEICNKLETNWDQQSCQGGVFMENISTSYGTKSEYLKDDDLIYPCNFVKENDKLYCYLMVTSRILNANGYNWEATAKLCQGAEKNWVKVCFRSYGRDASGSSRTNNAEILQKCNRAAPYGGMVGCVIGAAADITANDTGGARTAQFCQSVPGELQATCYWSLGTVSGGFKASSEERLADCRSWISDEKMMKACHDGSIGMPEPSTSGS